MTDPIATLRRYTSILPTTLARSTAAEAMDALEAEQTALRTPTGALTKQAVDILGPLCVTEEQKQALFVLTADATTLRTSAETMSHELAALRKSALDLTRLPEGWLLDTISYRWDKGGGKWWCDMFHARKSPRPSAQGTGPTPSTALSAAIERANEHGETK